MFISVLEFSFLVYMCIKVITYALLKNKYYRSEITQSEVIRRWILKQKQTFFYFPHLGLQFASVMLWDQH